MNRHSEVYRQIREFIESDYESRRSLFTYGIEIETQTYFNSYGECFWTTCYENLDRDDYMDTEAYYNQVSEEVNEAINESCLYDLVKSYTYSIQAFKSKYVEMYPIESIPFKSKVDNTRHWYSRASKCFKQRQNVSNRDLYRVLIQRLAEKDYSDYQKKIKNACNRYTALAEKVLETEFSYESLSYEYTDVESEDMIIRAINFILKLCGGRRGPSELFCSGENHYQSIEESIIESIDESDYHLDEDDIRDAFPELFSGSELDYIPHTESVDDASVSGPEIITIGGNDYKDVLDIGSDIFSAIKSSDNHYIDERCSAHVHVRLGDIKHYYGNGILHGAIMEYICFNFDRLPKSVRYRLNGGGNTNIRPEFKDRKSTWVHFHSQGTIEFRLFGNIDNTTDLEACINFALDALSYGYAVRLGDYSRALNNDFIGNELVNTHINRSAL